MRIDQGPVGETTSMCANRLVCETTDIPENPRLELFRNVMPSLSFEEKLEQLALSSPGNEHFRLVSVMFRAGDSKALNYPFVQITGEKLL